MFEERCWNEAFGWKKNLAISYVADSHIRGRWYHKSCVHASRKTGVPVKWIEQHAKEYLKEVWKETEGCTIQYQHSLEWLLGHTE